MSRCEIQCFVGVHPEDVLKAVGRTVHMARCVTHDWEFPVGQRTTSETRCPVGRIEEATEKAIEQINATQDHPSAALSGAS